MKTHATALFRPLAAALAVAAAAAPASALVINLNPVGPFSADALAAANRGAAQWAASISDPITVNLDVQFGALGANGLAVTNSPIGSLPYATVRNAMVASAAAEPDDAVVGFLPASAPAFNLPAGRTFGGNISATFPNLKALGLNGMFAPPANDGTIIFSNAAAFDFDNADGAAGKFDFESVATHEVGHALGFISALDDAGTTATPTTLDLFRFDNDTADDPSTPAQFTAATRGLVPGNDEIFDDLSNEYRFSTGTGPSPQDGQQGSHWKDDGLTGITIGIMDPTFAPGQIASITAADLRALDVIGYRVVVPEPASAAVLGLVGLALLRRRRVVG